MFKRRNVPAPATTLEPKPAPASPDPLLDDASRMDPVYCHVPEPETLRPRTGRRAWWDVDGVADPYALPGASTPTPTPTDGWGFHYAGPGAGDGLSCVSDHQAWPCEAIQAYRDGVMTGALDERSRNYDAVHALSEAEPMGSDTRVALYMAAQFVISQPPV